MVVRKSDSKRITKTSDVTSTTPLTTNMAGENFLSLLPTRPMAATYRNQTQARLLRVKRGFLKYESRRRMMRKPSIEDFQEADDVLEVDPYITREVISPKDGRPLVVKTGSGYFITDHYGVRRPYFNSTKLELNLRRYTRYQEARDFIYFGRALQNLTDLTAADLSLISTRLDKVMRLSRVRRRKLFMNLFEDFLFWTRDANRKRVPRSDVPEEAKLGLPPGFPVARLNNGVAKNVTIGDYKRHGDVPNLPLDPGREYEVIVAVLSTVVDVTKHSWSSVNVTTLSESPKFVSPIFVILMGALLAVCVFVLLLGCFILWCSKRMKKTTRFDDDFDDFKLHIPADYQADRQSQVFHAVPDGAQGEGGGYYRGYSPPATYPGYSPPATYQGYSPPATYPGYSPPVTYPGHTLSPPAYISPTGYPGYYMPRPFYPYYQTKTSGVSQNNSTPVDTWTRANNTSTAQGQGKRAHLESEDRAFPDEKNLRQEKLRRGNKKKRNYKKEFDEYDDDSEDDGNGGHDEEDNDDGNDENHSRHHVHYEDKLKQQLSLPAELGKMYTPEAHWNKTKDVTSKRFLVDKRNYVRDGIDVRAVKGHNDSDEDGDNEKEDEEKIGVTFRDEFMSLNDGVDMSENAATSETQHRNRFPHIALREHTRVHLEPDISSSNTIIHANFIKGCGGDSNYNSSSIKYIAAMSPFDHDTVLDFWRLIYQQCIETIVMTTNVVEGGIVKCAQYWPPCGAEVRTFGHFLLQTVEERVYADFVIRKIKLKVETDRYCRDVTQFTFTSWPEHGVPASPVTWLDMRYKVSVHHADKLSPILVHCGTGVSRSAAYIAIDALIGQYEQEGGVSVFSYVQSMRRDRPMMVRCLDQYVFIYLALQEDFEAGDTNIDVQDGISNTLDSLHTLNPRTGHTFLEDQFELLNLFTLDILSKDWTVARQLDKRKARVDGRFPQSFLPSNESGQPCKSYPLLDTVFIDGHRKRNKIVTLTTSLDDKSTVQFWRFVCEHNITTIIQLGRDSMEHRDTNINKKKSGSSKKSGLLTDDTVGDCDVTFRSETLSLHQYGAVHVRDVQLEMLRAGKKTYVKIRFFSLPHHRFHCASYEKTRRRSWASGKVGQKEESSSNSVEKDEDDDDQDGDKDREDEGSEDDEEEEEEETISEEDETDEGECNDIQKKTRASAYKIKALHDVYNQQKQRASSYSIQPNVDSRPHQRRSSYPGEYMSRQHRYSLSKSRRSAKDKFTQKADGGIWRFVQKVKGMTRSKSGTRDGGRRNEEKRGRDRIRERRDDAPSRRRWRSFAKRRTNDPREYRHSDWRERERDAYRRSQQSTRGQSRRNFSPERQSLKNAKMNAKGRFWPYQRDLNRGRNNYTRESETVSKHKLPPAWAKRSSRQMTSRGSYNTNRSASSGRSRDNRDGQRSMAQRMMKVYTSSHTNSQMGRTTHLASDRIFHTWREDNKYTYHSTSLTNLNHSNSALFSPCRYTNNCLARKASSTSSLCESKSLYQRSSDNRVRIEDFRANNSVTVFDEIKSCLTNSRQTKLSRSKSSSDILVVAKAGNVTDIIEELETPFPKMTSVSMNDLVTLEFHDNKLYYSQQNLPQNKITKKSKLARGSNIRWKFSKGITSAFNGSTDQDNEHSRNAVYVSTIQDSKHTKKAGYLIQDVGWTAFQKSEHVQSVQNESNLSLQAECEQRTGKLPYTEVNTVENKRKKNRCGWPSGNKGRASHEKREKLSSELHRDRNDNSSARRERKQTTKTKVKFRRRSQAGQTNRCLPHVSPGLVLELLESALDWHCTPLKEWARTRTQTPGKAWSGPQTSPILIHSPGDSGAANLLCACALVCERVQEENMVDVYHVIKHLRRRRPWAVECYAQYEFIHECLYNYVTEYMDDVTFTDRWIYRGVKDTSYRPAIEDSACPASPQWQRRAPNITLNARVHNVNTHDSFVAGTSVTEITGADGNSGNDVTHHNGNARSGLYAVDAKSAAADTELSPTKIQLCPDKEVFSPPPGVIHMTTKSQVQQMTQEADSGHIENVVLNSGQNHTKDGHDAVATRGRHLQLGENPMCSLLWENETEEESSPTKVSAYEGENEDQADNVIREDMPTNFGSEGVDGQMDSREIIFSQPMQMEVDDENVDENDDDMLCASVLEDTDHASIDDPTSDLHRADETSITVIQELERSLLSGNSPEF